MSLLVGVLVLLGSLLAGLLVRGPWPWAGEVIYGTQNAVPRVLGQTENTQPLQTEDYSRALVSFGCGSDECEGWLYRPTPGEGAAEEQESSCVIMAHGLGGQKDMGLHKYAHEFATNGFSVLVFDYRGFGGSGGDLRHYASPPRLLDDWESALKEMKGSGFGGQVQCGKMFLWGTSLSGGHVLVLASKHPNEITAAVSQMPYLSAKATSKAAIKTRGLPGSVKLFLAAVHDWLRSKAGLEPVYIPLVGKPGELAVMLMDEVQMRDYFAKHPKNLLGGWRPYVVGRVALEMILYSPLDYLKRDVLQTPVLLISCDKDHLCAPDIVQEAHTYLGSASELLQYSCSHFEIYSGDLFKEASKQMVSFFKRHEDADTV